MKAFSALKSITLSTLIVSSVSAQSLYWDPSGSGSASSGGSGNWDTSDPFWFNGASDVPWTDGNDAFFEGTAGTVTLEQNSSVADLSFTNVTGGDYVITNDGNNEVLTVANVIDTGGSEDTIATPIANSSILNKNGDGRLYLAVSNNISGAVNVNQGELSIADINSVGGGSVTVANGAALEVNSGTNNIGDPGTPSGITANITINGSGITNSGALRNPSGVNVLLGNLTLGQDNSVIYADSGSALILLPGALSSTEITDNGNNYNLIVSGSGTGDTYLEGPISIGGSLIVQGKCLAYLNGVTLTTWNSTYVGPTGQFFVENNISFGSGSNPASLITTNTILDGGSISSSGTYTMWANDGITATTNGGTLTDTSGTWTTCNIYSSNAAVTFTGTGTGIHPGGAAGTTLGTINLGTGAFIKGGTCDCNMGYANPSLEIYSNLVLNGGSLSFNYDQSSGQVSSLGALPSTLNASNILFNGGSMHVGHSTTIGATRGIFVNTNGGTIEDVVSSGGTVTINSPISGPGNISIPNGHSGVTSGAIFAGNNTYTGTTTIGASSQVTVGSGGNGTLGTGNTTDNGILVFNRTGSYTYGGNINGSGTLTKNASGTVTLTGACTYSGATTIGAGALLVDNTNASAITVNSSGVL
ncbi:MAG TPA: autotransporter-associated beta strand repeat-containing protein, partial [Verrucomicrobiae bacterium]